MTRILPFVAGLLAFLAAGLVGPAPARAQDFVASQIENLISTDTLKVEIEGLSGALSGNVRIERLTASDPQGVFLTAEGLALDWSPFSLVRSNVNVENLSVTRIVLDRLPTGQPEAQDTEGGGFSLPNITADIRRIAIQEFVLGEAVAGQAARLSAGASLTLGDDPVNLAVSAAVTRLDQPGDIRLNLAFAPAEDRLTVDIQASEPAGGLVANLLQIPDRPPVNLTITGGGPLSDFTANGQLTVGAEQAAMLTARVTGTDAGRRVAASLQVEAERYVPASLAPYVAGGTSLDVDVLLREDGTYLIDGATLASDAASIRASGTVDLAGAANDVTLSVGVPQGRALDLTFGDTQIRLAELEATLQGALSNAALSLRGTLPVAGFGAYVGQGVTANIGSPGFNLRGLTGPLSVTATAGSFSAPSGVSERFLDGEIRLIANGALTEDGLQLNPSKLTTGTAELNASGTAALNFAIFDFALQTNFDTSALSAALVPLAGTRTTLSGNVSKTLDETLSLANLALSGGGLSISGDARLANETVSAAITGALSETGAVDSSLSGAAQFRLTAEGPVAAPAVDLELSSAGLTFGGRELSNLQASLRGTFGTENPSGTVDISGTLDGAPLTGNARFETLPSGERRLSDLAVRQGPNSITGDIVIGENAVPTGTLTVAVEDIGPLASLAGRDATGDVNGTIVLDATPDDLPLATVDLTARRIALAGTSLTGADVDLAVQDYLGQPFADGTIRAETLDAGGIAVRSLALDLAREGDFTALRATAEANAVPVTLAGRARFASDATTIELRELTAAVEGAPVALAQAGNVVIANGTTTISPIRLSIGEGSASVEGTAGAQLNLTAALDAVPLSVAAPFAPGIDPAGTLTGNAAVTGQASNPTATFEVTGSDLSAAPLRAAGVETADLAADGRYAGGTLDLRSATIDLGEGSLRASGTAGETFDLTVEAAEIPVALANGFVSGLDASGTLSGNATVTGSRTEPAATFTVTGRDITAREIASADIAPLSLDLSGRYAGGSATIERGNVVVGNGRLDLAGTIGEALDVQVTATDLPVGLANGFVDGLGARGTVSGTASASGSLQRPNATFDLSGEGLTTAAIAASGIEPFDLVADGAYAEDTATIREARIAVGSGDLAASGTVGAGAIDLDVAARALPLGLFNDLAGGLALEGTLSGTANASGTTQAPVVALDVTGDGITTAEIRRSGIAPIALRLAGRFADNVATIETAVVNVGEGSITASGTAGETLDLSLALNQLPVGLANGFVEGLNASGTLSGTATATGPRADPQARFDLSGSGITAEAIAAGGIPPLSLDVSGAYAGGTATIETARVDVGTGSLTATGTVGQSLDLDVALDQIPVGLANGFVSGLRAEGTISGTAQATGTAAAPQARFDLSGSGITTAEIARSGLQPLAFDLEGSYADNLATIAQGSVRVGGGTLDLTGTVGDELNVRAQLNALPVGIANGFVPNLGASGTVSGTAEATGALADPQARFALQGRGITARQVASSGVQPLSFDLDGTYAGGTLTLGQANVAVGGGSLTATGSVGQALNLDVDITRLPVGLANGFVDGLGARGTLSGTARARGSLAQPDASFDVSVSDISTAQTRSAGAPAINGTAAGSYAGSTLTLTQAQIGVGGGTITASGTAGSTLALDVRISALPLSLAAAAAPDLSPQGTLNGTVQVRGTASNPAVDYDLAASGASIAPARAAGVSALGITARGRFENDVVTTDANLSGSGIALALAGSVNIAAGPSFDLRANGTAPLALANAVLAEGGRSVQGIVSLDLAVTGTAAAPNVTGTITTGGARFVDTGINLAINDISARIALAGQTARIETLTGSFGGGGTVTVGGTVGLTGGFPADLQIRVAEGRYNDGEIVSITLDADLTVTGDLTGSPVLAGTVNARQINVIVPERLPTSLARIDLEYRNAPAALLRQQQEIQPPDAGGGSTSGGLVLDLTFNAPNRVFVRGRGLDVELGGSIRIAGPVSAPQVVGAFDLQRGRFAILSRRLDFERGSLTFTGNLVPTLDLLATSNTGDVTVNIAVTGPANDPSFTFSSDPPLPEDEVLARLIFGQGTTDLSPLQIAQLAEAAATLAGVGGSSGLLENLRAQLGVDDLDIRTTEDGQTAVGVGQYLNDNTYLGVDSTGRVSLDLKLGSGVTARGSVNAQGGGEVGVFYEGEF
ncbi:translocation/assembly module TamB domain-containing protein [Antarcticirhabdus aurantiaca]|uniref:Translocation/assembly module TamB domain-containing protein n=1 Tax=Antarcticirhabdus aurantiaca TaxID=2606717 RepID=A0ACD4NLI3_9HYPH|nr:translocation/assembly module TamB domain-containing protein [Antarcticirhabdus aurantiaca]WAJ27684.1 translocation/assembly module TamB domain-containing protein [Jeongeuplla avenae]